MEMLLQYYITSIYYYLCPHHVVFLLPGDVTELSNLYSSVFADEMSFSVIFGDNLFEFSKKIVDFQSIEHAPSKYIQYVYTYVQYICTICMYHIYAQYMICTIRMYGK